MQLVLRRMHTEVRSVKSKRNWVHCRRCRSKVQNMVSVQSMQCMLVLRLGTQVLQKRKQGWRQIKTETTFFILDDE